LEVFLLIFNGLDSRGHLSDNLRTVRSLASTSPSTKSVHRGPLTAASALVSRLQVQGPVISRRPCETRGRLN
jgi:hypothetical protein